jgi:hypothetical protein
MPMSPTVLEPAVRNVEQFCANRIPLEMRSQIRLEHAVRGNAITIIERRPPWSDLIGPEWTRMKIAQLRYDERDRTWTLYARDSSERWFLYIDIEPAPEVGPLLAEIDEDPTGIFWG